MKFKSFKKFNRNHLKIILIVLALAFIFINKPTKAEAVVACNRCSTTYDNARGSWSGGDTTSPQCCRCGDCSAPCDANTVTYSKDCTCHSGASDYGYNSSCQCSGTPWGTVESGFSGRAYNMVCGACSSETRTCTNGVLSGSYQYSSCPACASCPASGGCGSTASGGQCTSYSASSLSCGYSCSSYQRTSTCTNGSWDLTPYSYSSCSVGSCTCAASGGCGTTSNGGYCTTYSTSSTTCPNVCSSYSRTSYCSNGSWDYAPYAYSSCNTGGCASCSASGACPLTGHGGTCTTYSSSAPACGSACTSRLSTCNNGSWDLAPYANGSCSASCCASGACSQTTQGNTCTSYSSSTVACGTLCSTVARTSTCQASGAWNTAPYANASCSVTGGTQCSFNSVMYNSGQTVTGYASASPSCGSACSSATLTCQCNGTWSPSGYAATSCTASCCLSGACAQTTQGNTCTSYSNSNPSCGTSCSSVSRLSTCQASGAWDTAPYTNTSCNEGVCASCNGASFGVPWAGTIPHNGTITAYQNSSVTSPTTCASIAQTRTCNNGTLSGSYTYQSCTVVAGNCVFPTSAVAAGSVFTISSDCNVSQTMNAVNGVMDSNASSTNASNSAAIIVDGAQVTLGASNGQALVYGKIVFQSTNLAVKTDSTVGTTPYNVVAADFNGDGKPDLAVTNYGSNTVSIFLNTGTSPYFPTTANQTLTAGTSPVGIVAGDFNGDGKIDLAVTNYGTTTAYTYLNTGNTSTPFPTTYSQSLTTGTSPQGITAGDFNGDGKIDLAITNSGTTTMYTYLNTGNTSTPFNTTNSQSLTTGTTPRIPIAADFNGDGKIDLAVPNYGSNTVYTYLNTGNTSTPFNTTNSQSLTTGTQPRSISAADFNGDGKPDLAVTNYGATTAYTYLNTGNTSTPFPTTYSQSLTTGTSPYSIEALDMNGDGKPDLAVTNYGSTSLSVFLNNGSGAFNPKVDYTTGTNPIGVDSADFNGDGRPDLAVVNYGSNTLSTFLHNPMGKIIIAKHVGAALVRGPMWIKDSDGDGYPDTSSPLSVASVNGARPDATYVRYNIDQSNLATADCAPTDPNLYQTISGLAYDPDQDGYSSLAPASTPTPTPTPGGPTSTPTPTPGSTLCTGGTMTSDSNYHYYTFSTNGSYTFSCPFSKTGVIVKAWGGGGFGGDGAPSYSYSGGGGAGGSFAQKTLNITSGNNYNVAVGIGGQRNIWVYATDSYFQDTSTCLAKAGGAGVSAGSSSNGTGGTYTAGSVGDITHNGGNGAGGSSSYGGGGGGSAGTGSNGNNASGSTGATAVTNGGPGGNGSTSSAGGYLPSSGPGGGGGAGMAGSVGNNWVPANGYDGQIIIAVPN